MAAAASTRPAWAGALEWIVVLAFAALWGSLAARLVGALDGPTGWLLPGVVGVGVLAADFASGLVHWFCDSVFEEDTPLVGPLVILPFREHHRDPLAMTHHAFLEITGSICLALGPALLLGLCLLPMPALGAPGGQLVHALLLATTAAAFWTNQLHKWATRRRLRPLWHGCSAGASCWRPARTAAIIGRGAAPTACSPAG